MNPAARPRIDALLREAVATGEVPGVVALAATAGGVVYEGAFGRRSLPDGPAMSLDSVVWIASMTKAITAVAAMQLVEQGRLALDRPAAEFAPQLAAPMVLDGFDGDRPLLRPARTAITLRHLLTHTAGFSYETWNADYRRYVRHTGLPGASSGRLAALAAPLVFDPGARWEYGISLDWVGRLVELVSGQTLDAYMREHILTPLGMHDTGFVLRPDQEARLVKVHRRDGDGQLRATERERLHVPEFFPGGGTMHATGPDYLRLLRMLLNGGRLSEAVVLRPETVALMMRNHIGGLPAGRLHSVDQQMSHDLDLFSGQPTGWGLSFLINLEDAPTGRRAGSVGWAGMGNSYFWLDPKRGIAGVLLTQILPFADPAVLRLLAAFEATIHED